MKYDLELPKTYTVNAAGGDAECVVNVENLTDEIIAKLAMHGLRQKIADAAAGAKKLSEAEDETRTKAEIAADLMEKVRKNLEAGDWGAERGTGATGDPLDPWRVKVVRKALANNPKLKKQYDAIPPQEQAARREFLLEIARAKADVVDPAATRMMEASKVDVSI